MWRTYIIFSKLGSNKEHKFVNLSQVLIGGLGRTTEMFFAWFSDSKLSQSTRVDLQGK